MVRLRCSGEVSRTAQLSPAQLSSQLSPAQPIGGGEPKPTRVLNTASHRRYGAIGLLGRRLPYSPAQPSSGQLSLAQLRSAQPSPAAQLSPAQPAQLNPAQPSQPSSAHLSSAAQLSPAQPPQPAQLSSVPYSPAQLISAEPSPAQLSSAPTSPAQLKAQPSPAPPTHNNTQHTTGQSTQQHTIHNKTRRDTTTHNNTSRHLQLSSAPNMQQSSPKLPSRYSNPVQYWDTSIGIILLVVRSASLFF